MINRIKDNDDFGSLTYILGVIIVANSVLAQHFRGSCTHHTDVERPNTLYTRYRPYESSIYKRDVKRDPLSRTGSHMCHVSQPLYIDITTTLRIIIRS